MRIVSAGGYHHHLVFNTSKSGGGPPPPTIRQTADHGTHEAICGPPTARSL